MSRTEITAALNMSDAELKKLLDRFNKEYDFLYTHENVSGEREAMQAFDCEILPNLQGLLNRFAALRQDLIMSDREAAAFAFALLAV